MDYSEIETKLCYIMEVVNKIGDTVDRIKDREVRIYIHS